MSGQAQNDLEITLSQKVIRADGSVEDLGVTASTADGSIRISGEASEGLLLGLKNQLKRRYRA